MTKRKPKFFRLALALGLFVAGASTSTQSRAHEARSLRLTCFGVEASTNSKFSATVEILSVETSRHPDFQLGITINGQRHQFNALTVSMTAFNYNDNETIANRIRVDHRTIEGHMISLNRISGILQWDITSYNPVNLQMIRQVQKTAFCDRSRLLN